MKARRKAAFDSAATGIVALLGLTAAAGLITVYTGAYNVAATEEHTSFVRWAFDTTFQKSVERRAEDVVAPPQFTPAMVEAGAAPYKSMCQHCRRTGRRASGMGDRHASATAPSH